MRFSSRFMFLGVTVTVLLLTVVLVQAIEMPTSSLRLWLKADAITGLNDGDAVASWTNSAGTGFHATNATAVSRPRYYSNVVNGKPAVRFDGVTNYLYNTAYTHGANDGTMVVVVKRNAEFATPYRNILIQGATDMGAAGNYFWQIYANFTSPYPLLGNFNTAGLDLASTGANLTNVFQIVMLQKDNAGGGASRFYYNGILKQSGTGTQPLSAAGYWLGGWRLNYLDGDITEAAIYNTALGAADRELVEGLLAWKYGLQGDLPVTHPWKSADPTPIPTIVNGTPASVTSTGATLVGNLTSGAYPMSISVFWGTADAGHPTNGLWQHTNTFAWASGVTPSTNVTLPTPDSPYFYRFYATNAYGDSYAPDAATFYASDSITWIQAAAGTHYWTNAANWLPAAVPNAAGLVVSITNQRTGDQTINVGQTITLGELILDNTNTIALAKLTGGAFRFDKGSQNGRIRSGTAAHSIAVDVVYGSGSGLEITNDVAFSMTANLGGFSNLVKTGIGQLTYYGTATYTGDFYLGPCTYSTGNGTPAAGNTIPNSAWVELQGTIFTIPKNNEAILGVRGSGRAYVSNSGRLVIGTNTADSATYTTRLVAGGKVAPGWGATVGDLYLTFLQPIADPAQPWHADIKGGDIYIDLTGATTYDRVLFRYGSNTISGGNLHLNFLTGYTPTNGANWNVINTVTAGTITDPDGGRLFNSIDANLAGFGFTAEIVSDTSVRVTALRQGTLVILR